MPTPEPGTSRDLEPWSGPGLPASWKPPEIELRILGRPIAGRRDLRTLLGGGVAVFILSCFAAPWLQETAQGARGAPAATGAIREVPPSLRPYYDRAVAGDAGAMRLLAGMYYYGLNAPQDRQEGLRWYRRAAAAGDAGAVRELAQIGSSAQE